MAFSDFRIKIFLLVLVALVFGDWSAHTFGAVPSAPGTRFRDCPGDCPEMIVIPAGRFMMGTERADIAPDGRDGPVHSVVFQKPFAIGVFDVTRDEYARFVRATHRRNVNGCDVVDTEGRWFTDPNKDWRNPGFKQTGRDPVVCVSWQDAQAYSAWLNSKLRPNGSDNGPYRLPSDAEWEYAARAGTTSTYYWGSVPSQEFANYGMQDCYPCGPSKHGRDRWFFTSPVGSFPPNAFGLHDALGNAWQWTADCMHYGFTGAPTDGSAWITDTNDACHNRILRGGSWLDPGRLLDVFERNPWGPGVRNYANGFRVARTLE